MAKQPPNAKRQQQRQQHTIMEEKSTKTDDNSNNDNSMAIDFHRMMLEERKRAKAERQRKKQLLKQQQQQEKDTPTQDDDHKKKEAKNKLKDEIDSLFSSLPILLQNNDDMAPIISPAHLHSIRYSSTFLHPSYTQHLLSYLQSLPQTSYNASSSDTSSSSSNGKWTLLPHAQRRVLLLDDTTTTNNNNTIPPCQKNNNIPLPIVQIIQKISPYFPSTHQPNHVLINEYDATGGIMAHTDGPCYHPTTVTISIGGGHVLLKFTPRTTMDDQEKATDDATHEVILKGNGSIICFANDMYTNYCHGIEEGVWMEQPNVERCLNYNEESELKEVKRGYRISLTFRHKFVASS